MSQAKQTYGKLAQFFHWSIAALLVVQIPLAYYMINQPLSPDKLANYALHKSLGMGIFSLSTLRLVWRSLNPPPPLPAGLPALQLVSARLTQWLLYGITLAMPVIGWLSSSAANFPVNLFGFLTLPDLVAPDLILHERLELTHRVMAYGLFGLLSLHIGAALHHRFVKRDQVLASMLPRLGRSLRPTP